MANKRAPIEKLDVMVNNGIKKYVRYAEGAELFSMGQHAFMDLAKESGAVRKINGICLVNIEKLNEYIEDMYS